MTSLPVLNERIVFLETRHPEFSIAQLYIDVKHLRRLYIYLRITRLLLLVREIHILRSRFFHDKIGL